MSKDVKISVLKLEMVNDKKTYKVFDFKLDPKEMAKFKTEATVKKKVAEYVAKSGIYKPSELKDLKYDMKEFLEEWKKMLPVVKEEELKKLDQSPNHPETRVTPHLISRLAVGEVFVFGSNAMGRHDGGAARGALEKFGAIRGQGHGLQGMSYAIDSMSGMDAMKKDVDEFIEFAKNNPDKTFLVTPIGCGIAGMRPSDVAPMFKRCRDLKNVCLPSEFWDIIGWQDIQQPQYNLFRFIDAQDFAYTQALEELKNGQKRSHWIWYIFPQQKGLGHSHNAKFYGLDGEGEARAYVEHQILGERLRECCRALLLHKDKSIRHIMGSNIDVIKLNTSMNLFNRVCPNDVFKEVLETFF